jgi:16S rRNA (adenine1518-N6/adenine1519-N6)-dimethyltransferase
MRAKRSLGQNFLVDPNLQRKIVDALDLGHGDTVLEIGPGRGALTDRLGERLADLDGRLIAVELDDDLADQLRHTFDDRDDVDIVHADFLAWDPAHMDPDRTLKVVGNIPYNITSPILFRVLEWRPVPERIVLMVQKEVADRLLAAPGGKAYGALTVGVRAQARVDRLFAVGRNAFRPVPAVDSAVIRITPRPASGPGTGPPLRALTRAAFGMRRKQLQKILRTAPGYGLAQDAADRVLAGVGLQPQDRPESLEPETFVHLAAALERLGYPE